MPHYVRANLFLTTINEVKEELEKDGYECKIDDIISDILSLPSSIDLHNHPLITSGKCFIQVSINQFI